MERQKKKDTDMTEGVIWKQLLWFALPLMVGNVFQQFYNTVDSIVVGNFVGKEALAAVGSVGSIINSVIGFFGGLATGASVVIAQSYGAKNDGKVSIAVHTTFCMTLVLCVVFTIVGISATPFLLRFMSMPDDVIGEATEYLMIYFSGVSGLMIYNMGAGVLRAVGDSKVSMKVSLVANLVNIAGNAILIYGARIGAAGAALSTLFSRILSAVMIIVLLGKSDKIIVSNHWRIDTKILGKILYIGVPNGLENSIFQIGKLLTTSLIAGFGMAATTANAVTGSIASFQQIPANAIGVAMITVIGQCIGAGETEQALYYLKKMMKVAYACMILLGIPMIIFARPICGIYHLSPETMKITVFLLCYSCVCCMLVHPLSFAQSNALRAAGDVRFTMIVAIASMWLCRVGMAYILGQGLGLGVIGVWIAMTMDWVVRAFLFTNRVRTGKWLKYKDRLVK